MEITRQKTDQHLVIQLAGRMDANWCGHVQNALAAAVREGEHRVHLDMARVDYVSSAGLRVLLSFYKQLKGIDGLFRVVRPAAAVRSVLELAGLELLIAPEETRASTVESAGETQSSRSAKFELFRGAVEASTAHAKVAGQANALHAGASAAPSSTRFGPGTFALGVGALGSTEAECAARYGEFLAVAGVAAFQPTDGSSRPDFVVTQKSLVPEGRLLVGLSGAGEFSLLARFEATAEARSIGLHELASTLLDLSRAKTIAFAAVTETAGLVAASLRQSPASATAASATAGTSGGRFGFPQIRDWLSFTSERAFRESTSLLVGVVSRGGSSLDPILRPLAAATNGTTPPLLGHVHAAAFPYRPLRKGRIEMTATIQELFENQSLQAVVHLLNDPRSINGAGQSEFLRGAAWFAPVAD